MEERGVDERQPAAALGHDAAAVDAGTVARDRAVLNGPAAIVEDTAAAAARDVSEDRVSGNGAPRHR